MPLLSNSTAQAGPLALLYWTRGVLRICDHEDGTIGLSSLLDIGHRRPWHKRRQSFTKLRCRDPSHHEQCRKAPGGSFPKSNRDCGTQTGYCNGCRWPTIRGLKKDPGIFDIYWTAYIPFNGQKDALRSEIADICNNAGRYVVPHPASATKTPEFRCFDPNDCHCITYSGTENVHWEWECGPWLPGTTKCISDPFRGFNTLPPTRPSSSVLDKQSIDSIP